MSNLELTECLEALVAETTRYPGTSATLLPDLVLYSFATDVREHATAVGILAEGVVPRASFANARAALESAIDISYLVCDSNLYTYRGAQAHVAALFESEAIEQRAREHKLPVHTDAPLPVDADAIIIADAKEWDAKSPGAGVALKRAWEAWTKAPGAGRRHWSLVKKDQVLADALASDDEVPLGERVGVIYALLSMDSHPRPRAGSREMASTEDGSVILGTKAADSLMATQIAALACKLATRALQIRRNFPGTDF